MYDYRNAIKHIIENTNNSERELTNTAYAINTICNIILDQKQTKKYNSEDDITPTTEEIQASNTAEKEERTKAIAYSKIFCQKIQKIFDANSDIGKYTILKQLKIGANTGKHILEATDDIISKNSSPYFLNLAENVRNKIATKLNVENEVILNDSINLTEEQAKHALDNFKENTTVKVKTPTSTTTNIKLNEYDSFGEMLKDIRKQRNETQLELSKNLNVTMSAISQIENNKYAPSVSFVINLSKLLKVSIAELKDHIKITDSENNFVLTHNTDNKELIAYTLKKPLPLNTYLARRELNGIKLINNRSEIVYESNQLNSQTESIHTGDLVSANIINNHQAHILQILPQNLQLDNIVTIKNAVVTYKNNHWITYGSPDQSIAKLNPERDFFSIADGFAVKQNINYKTNIDIAWRKQEPKYITITNIQQPVEKTASKY